MGHEKKKKKKKHLSLWGYEKKLKPQKNTNYKKLWLQQCDLNQVS